MKRRSTPKQILNYLFIISFCLLNIDINGIDVIKVNRQQNADNHPVITQKMRKAMRPYLLPKKHPIQATLHTLFKASRITANAHTFAEAGFITLFHQPASYIRVAQHLLLPGFLLKLYLDDEKRNKDNVPGWQWLVNRCEGAKNVRRLIKRKRLQHFTAPDKWLYPLPVTSTESDQPVILVVTNMDLVSSEETAYAWYHLVTPEILDELFCILSHGYSSCYVAQNIPLTKSGKFACVDTEYPKRDLRHRYREVKKYLSPEMQLYWDTLTR